MDVVGVVAGEVRCLAEYRWRELQGRGSVLDGRLGVAAPLAVTAADGNPRGFLRPDLPIEGLSKFLARKSLKKS